MKLKSIEISGFKSFADRTKIEFRDGMTGIVGPNGSGKSNITEAIRWVMGEQSAKSLRGGKMPDIIFAGTEKRKPLARASVTIVFDNADYFLKTNYTEVVVTRRLFRNGDSQYQINHIDCRLKDILNLFIDTGLGRESFSIISQGRVESIFNSKPEDRRSIIEEVAGVLEYKQNKQKAESELAKTSGYLERVNDLIVELDKQRGPLEEQASLARDYVDQKQRYDRLDQTRLVRAVDNNLKTQKELQADLNAKTELLADLTKKAQTTTDDRNTNKSNVAEYSTKRDQLQDQLVNLTRLQEQVSGQQNLLAEQRKNREAKSQELNQQIKSDQDDLEQIEAQLRAVNTNLQELREKLSKLTNEAKEMDRSSVDQQKAHLTNEIEDLRADYMQTLQQLTSVKNERTFMQKNAEQNEQKAANLDLNVQGIQATRAKQTAEKERLESEVANLKEKLDQLQTSGTKISKEFDAANQEYHEVRNSWLKASDVLHRAETRLESLKGLQSEHAGFYQGTKAALRLKNQYQGLVGAVSEIIEVSSENTLAIETALGSQLQNIVTTDETTAKSVINTLRTQRLGRATFLPLSVIRPKYIADNILQRISGIDGFVGIASDLVKTSTSQHVVAEYLLGSTLVANTLDTAVEISRLINQRCRIVTLNGDLVGVGGTMTGGQNKNNRQGLLQQDQEVKGLQSSVDQMQEQLLKQEQNVSEVKEQRDQLEIQLQEQRTTYTDQKQILNRAVDSLDFASERLAETEKRLKATGFELRQVDTEDDVEEQLQKLDQSEARLNQEVQKIKEETEAKQLHLQQLSENQYAYQQQIMDLQVQITQVTEQIKQAETDQKRLADTKQELVKNIASAKTNLQRLDQNQVEVPANKSLDDIKSERISAEKQLKAVRDNLDELEDKSEQLDLELERNTELLQNMQSEVTGIRSDIKIASNTISISIDRLEEDYDKTLDQARQNVLDIDSVTLERDFKLTKRGLAELGTVNIGAIEEFDRVSERYDFLSSQKSDLLKSAEQLNQSISEMDTEASSRFKTTFDEVAEAFSEVFVKMFGGGQAKLELTDPDKLLDTGIEIKAQPPGKKLQRLSLLSGGEKSLTAITLLFAILQVKPVPFCILDEVEAAFDDANVDRFAHYLKTFRDTTQFIVITHRKGTMVEADVLYGVTMQESGVSKMVSVSLEEAQEKELV